MDNVKQNDWIALNLLNEGLNIDKLASDGINSLNTGIRPKEDYLQLKTIQETFTDDSGAFNQALFDDFYKKQLETYTQFASIDQDKFLMDTFEYDPLNIDKTTTSKLKTSNFEIKRVPNPFETSSYFHDRTEGPRALSIAELAQKNKYFDNKTGKWSDKSPNELGALGTLSETTLALAQWEKDGVHKDSNGNEVTHSKGDFKLNPEEKFYYETLDGKEAYGKQVLGVLDVLTTDGSAWNKIDVFDTDDIEINPIKSVARTIAIAAPFLIPGVDVYWAGLTASLAFAEAMPSLIKTFGGLLDPDYSPSKGLNSFENFTKKFSSTPSEYNQEHAWSFDNIMQFASTSAQQLFQQRWIAKIPSMLGMDKRVEAGIQGLQKGLIEDAAKKGLIRRDHMQWAMETFEKTGQVDSRLATIIQSMPEYKKAWDIYNKYQKTSTALARTYLVVTSAADTYGDAINLGFDRQTAGLISAATYTGFYTLFNHDYFKSYLMTGTDLGEEAKQLRGLVYNYLKGRGKEELGEISAKKGAIGVFNKFKDRVNQLWTEVVYGGRTNIATSMFSEATEETIEELMQDAAKGIIGNGFVALKQQLGYNAQGHYNWAESDPFQRYLLSFVGGGIGGGIFGLENAIRTRKGASNWNSLMSNMPELQKQILSKINSGQKDDLIRVANSFRGKALGSNTLSYDERGENGEYLPTKDASKTQNAYLIDSFINHVNGLDAFLEQEGIKYSDGDLANIPVYRGLTAYYLNLESQKEGNQGFLDLMARDLGRLQLKLNDLHTELKNLEKDEHTDPAIINATKAQYNYIKTKINKLVTGGDETYFGRLMTAYIPSIFKFHSPNIENFAKSVFNVDYSTASDAIKSHIDSQYKKYTESGQSEIDAYISYDLYNKMSRSISETLNNTNTPASNIAAFTGVGRDADIVFDPLLGITRYNDYTTAVIDEQEYTYAKIVESVYDYLKESTLNSNRRLIYHISNYIFTRLKYGNQNIPKFLNLFIEDQSEYDDAILNAKVGEDTFMSDTYEDGYYAAFDQLTHNIIKHIALESELTANDPNVSLSDAILARKQAEHFTNIDGSPLDYILEKVFAADEKIDSFTAALSLDSTDFIEDELIKLGTSKQTYTLDASVKSRINNYKIQLLQLRTLIKGATSVTRSAEKLWSVNEVINDFNKQHENEKTPLPVINSDLAQLILNKITFLESKINALETISSINAVNENLREQKLSVYIKLDRIKSLSNLSETSVTFLTDNGIPLLPEFESVEDINIDDLTQEQLQETDVRLEQIMINNEDKLHSYYNSLTNEQKDKFIDLLTQVYKEYEKEPAYLSLNVEANTDSQHHMDALNFWYVVSNLIAPPDVFYKPYKEVILKDEFDKAPFYSQELIVRLAIQFLNGNQEEKKRILNIIGAKIPNDPKIVEWSPLINTFRFSAGAGVGKTAAIIPLIQLVQNKIGSNKYLYMAPTESHLDKLSEESGNKYTIEQLFKVLSEELKISESGKAELIDFDPSKIKDYLKLDGRTITFNFGKYDLNISENLKDLFGENSILFIDEGTYVSKEQYIILDELAKKIGFKIITTGDILQAGVEGTEGDTNSFNRCLTFIGPSLYESKRVTTNIGKWNSSTLSKIPYNDRVKNFTLQYAADPNSPEFVGIRSVNSNLTQEELNKFISDHPDASIAIYNVESSSLIVSGKVESFDDISKIQGKEFDYVIINGDLTLKDENEQLNSETKFNTILTRAKKGTVIYGKIINNHDDNVSIEEKGWDEVYEINLNDESIKLQQQYRKNTIDKITIPNSSTGTSTPTVGTSTTLPEPTEQLTEEEIPLQRSILRVHTFYNRFGGVIDDNGIYHRGRYPEDLNLFIMDDADIRSDIFRKAAIKYNALKNNLLFKLSGKSYRLEGIDDGGEFLIKVSKFDPNTDLAWGKGNFDESKDLSQAKYFKRLIYKAGDREVTLLIFPNNETIQKGDNVQGNTQLLEAINDLRAENDNPTYYKFDTDVLKFFGPDNPIFFDPINESFENKRHWTKYQWRQGSPDYEYSFFTSSLPVRFKSDWLNTEYDGITINELYNQLDNFYKRCAETWDSLGLFPNNPFKQRGSLKPKHVSRIEPAQFTIFTKLRSEYDDTNLSLDEALAQYVADLKQAHQIMQNITATLENSTITPEVAEEISRKAKIRQTIQHIGLTYNYKPEPEWEDKFKSDLLLLGTKASHNNLDKNIRSWIHRIRTIQTTLTDKPEWIKNVSTADLEGILQKLNNISGGQAIFVAGNSEDVHYMNVLWNIYNNIYKNVKEFNELVKSADDTVSSVNENIFANVDQSNYQKNARIQLVPENIPYEQAPKFIYERGWSLMSFYDDGRGLQAIFTPYNEEVEESPTEESVTEETAAEETITEETENEILPENDLLTEECMDLLDEQNDHVKGFVNFVRSKNNGIFVTSNDLNSAEKKTFRVQIGNRTQNYTFSSTIAAKIEAYMQSKESVFDKTRNQNLFLGGIDSFLNILNAGEEC